MSIYKVILNLLLILIAVFTIGSCTGNSETTITIHGSTTLEPVLQKAAEYYIENKSVKINITGNGSIGGIKSLLNGKCQIASSSYEITQQEKNEARKKGITLKEILIGHDVIVPIVHRSNTAKGLFLGQFGDMYKGLINDWEELDGIPGKIIAVRRNDNSGTNYVWNKKVMASVDYKPECIVKSNNSDVLAFVAKNKGAIGYISKTFLNNEVKALTVNSFEANKENVKLKRYPLIRKIMFYVNEESFKGDVKSFIVFMLSNEGQTILANKGLIPAEGFKE